MKIPNPFGKKKAPDPVVRFEPVKPEVPFCVIGDVHGRIDLLETLVDALPKDMTIICVGDLIDRGDYSAQVLRYVQENELMTSLMGNHEEMLLNFIKNPEKQGRRWLRNGGLQTLASFGIAGVTETSDTETLVRRRDDLYEAMGESMLQWLSGLECVGWSGNVAVAHAGADPNTPLHLHKPETFIWGHPEFRKKPRNDGFWIVHGHTIVDRPKMREGRISVDTGAYATGNLTAAVITEDGVEFLST